MTGHELKVRRVDARVKVFELAASMRVHSSRVSQIEALLEVTPKTSDRYLEALDRLAASTGAEATA